MDSMSVELRKRFEAVRRALQVACVHVQKQVALVASKASSRVGGISWIWWLLVLLALVRVLVLPLVVGDSSGLRLAV